MFLEIGPLPLAVDFFGLRRSGSPTQLFDLPQDFPKQVPGHGDFCDLDRDVATVTDNLGSNFDLLLPQHDQRPAPVLLVQAGLPLWVTTGPDRPPPSTSVKRPKAEVLGKARSSPFRACAGVCGRYFPLECGTGRRRATVLSVP